MGQGADEKWTAAVNLQPTLPKPDRLPGDQPKPAARPPSKRDLPATHLAYLVGSHVIVYRVGADSLGVVRILHQRMSLARHV